MVPAPSATTVAVVVVGVISVTLVGYILLRRRKNGTATRQQDVATSSPNTKPTSQSPSLIPSTQDSAATWKDDATSSPNTKSTSLCPSPSPSTQDSDSSQGTDMTDGVIGTNHGVDGSNEATVDTSDQDEAATRQGDDAKSTSQSHSPIPSTQDSDSSQGTDGVIETNHGVNGSNEATVDASDQVKTAAATLQGDGATSSPNAKSTSQSPSPIPSTQDSVTSFLSDFIYSPATGQGDNATSSPNAKSTSRSPSPIPPAQDSDSSQGTDGVIGTNHGVDGGNEATIDASDQVKGAAATRQGDDAKSTSRSPSPMPSAQASDSSQGTDGVIGTNHGVDDSNEATIYASDQDEASSRQGDNATSSSNAKPTPSPSPSPFAQASVSIRDIGSVRGNNPIIVGSSGVNITHIYLPPEKEAATGQGDVATSSSNAKPTSQSPSPSPFSSDSPEGAGATETNQRVDGSKKPTVDASDKVKSAGIIAATGQGEDATSSPNAQARSPSPSPIPSTQASAATGQEDIVTSSPSTKPTSPSPSPTPSAQASGSPQPTGAIGNSGTISGSHEPIIVGASGVNVTYNFPLEGPGVPAPRPQLSQRPDQEPRLTDSCQEAEPRLDERTLLEVAMRLRRDWVTLAVELGSTMVQIQIIETNYPKDVTRQGLDMLVTWKCAQSTSDEQQRTTLCTALKNIGRADIAGFLHGVPAPRPHQSQRPDQEPRLTDPCQEAGNKTRDFLKRVYKTGGSYLQLLPEVYDDQMHIAGIYTPVQLDTREGVASITGQKGETVNSTEYAKIFRLRTTSGKLIKRLIFIGMGGVGKSTIFDKIPFDWAEEANEILNGFKLVFLLKMCALSQESDLVDSIFDQLLEEDSGIAKDELDKFILANSNEVLILLDGFDQMKTKTLHAASFGSVLKALNRTRYRECVICIATRPSHLETLMSKSLVQNPCTCVEVLGFTHEDVHEYIRKFYYKDPDSGSALIQTIGKSNTLLEFAKVPMLLLLVCLLWRENEQLPETTSRLFNAAVDHIFTRKHISGKDGSKTVISIGQTALRGLTSANQKFSFPEDEFEPKALELALKAGILTKQRVIKNYKSHNNIQFMHKTMQEYSAAKYLQSVHMSKQGYVMRAFNTLVQNQTFVNNLRQLCQTIEAVVSNEFLLRFCCGDNEKCMTDIVNLLDRNFSKDKPKYQSHVIQAISRNCFFESQSSNVPRCLTSDLHIPSTIEVRHNNDFRHLMYLLEVICRSDSRTAQLARVETIQVSSVSSVSDLAVALGYMENLRALRLDKCPLVKGDLEKTLWSLKCNQHLTSLDIEGCNTLGGRAVDWAPHIKHLTSLNTLRLTNCRLQLTDIEHIASAVRDMPKLTDLYLHGHRLGGLQSLFPSHIKVHSS